MTELFQQLLVEEADEELGWQERALCAQTGSRIVLPREGRIHAGGEKGLPRL